MRFSDRFLILLGLSLDSSSSVGGQVFTLSLALIWERSLRRMCFDMKAQTGWTPVAVGERTRRWDDSYGTDDPSRWLRADVMLERHSDRWVLDAKYKRAFGGESREDRFQMCAYAVAFDADRATLVYPTASDGDHAVGTLLSTSVGAKKLVIDSMDLPMSSGPQACITALMRIWKTPTKQIVTGGLLSNCGDVVMTDGGTGVLVDRDKKSRWT